MADVAHPAREPWAASSSVLVVLLAAVTALAAELVRTSGPFIDAAFTAGVVPAALTATLTYAAAGALLLALCARRPVDGRVLLLGVGALVVARLATQALTGTLRYGIGLATVALAITVLVLTAALTARVSGRAAVTGVSSGLALSAALSLALGTWDAVWRPGLVGWGVPLALLVVAGALAWRLRRLPPAPAVRGLWLLGPYLGLAVMTVANPAFLASQAGLPLWTSAVVVLTAAGVTLALLARPLPPHPHLPVWGDVVLVVVLCGSAAGAFFLVGWPQQPGAGTSVAVAGCLAVLACAAPLSLARALTRPPHPQVPGRLAGAAACAGLGLVLPVLVYQLDYDVPLGVPNALVPVAVAGLLGLMAVRSRYRARELGATTTLPATRVPMHVQVPVAAATLVLAVVGVAVTTGGSDAGPRTAGPGSLRLLDWNLHYGVSARPAVELDAIVDVVRASGADVVTLQEVSRGWVLGGGVDMADRLGRELGMDWEMVPAADRQFGNVILWKPAVGPPTDVVRTPLPEGHGPQRRSALSATFDVDGTPLRITSVHLQHRMENVENRLDQISTLLAAERPGLASVVAGDLNAEPGWPEPALFLASGMVSAQDTAGDPSALTYPSDVPTSRIDWVLGAGVTFSDVEVLATDQSDHRPVLVTVTVPVP